MSNFKNAILFMLRNEGGFSNIKADKGGATNFGISLRFLKMVKGDVDGNGHVDKKDIIALTKDKAIEFYKTYFWDHYKLDSVRDVLIGSKIFDLFVNMRGKTAAKIVQTSCNDLGAKLKVDGIAGSMTYRAVNQLGNFSKTHNELMNAIRVNQAAHYTAIVKNDKTQKVFLNGWLARAKL